MDILDIRDIRVMLGGVGEYGYAHKAGQGQPAQQHLSQARQALQQLVPAGMRVRVSGSGQSLPVVPWIAVLDEGVTTTAQEGLYVVYLYRQDLSRVYLSMNQGATQHRRNAEESGLKGVAAENAACEELSKESELIRSRLSAEALDGMLTNINLGAPGYFLPRAYERGNIAAVEYDLDALPDEGTLREHLTRFRALYSTCIEVKDEIRVSDPAAMQTTSGSPRSQKKTLPPPKPPMFRPKDAGAYIAHVKAHKQVRDRRHEALIKAFGTWIAQQSLTPASNVHPRDMVVEYADHHWLIEAKTVSSNPELAVRAAIGQLMSYRHFIYREQGQPDPHLVALFSESIGGAFIPLLHSLGIEAIWQVPDGWAGSAPLATPDLLATALGTG